MVEPDEEQVEEEDYTEEDEDPEEGPMEGKDPEEDPLEEEGPKEDPIVAKEDPVAGLIEEDEGWIEDPLEDSDDDNYIDWEAELQHIDDVHPEEDVGEVPAENPIEDFDGEGFIDWDAEIHINDLPLEEQGIWLLDLDEDIAEAVPNKVVEEEIGELELVDPILVEVHQAEDEEDILAAIVQQAQHQVQAA